MQTENMAKQPKTAVQMRFEELMTSFAHHKDSGLPFPIGMFYLFIYDTSDSINYKGEVYVLHTLPICHVGLNLRHFCNLRIIISDLFLKCIFTNLCSPKKG